MMLIVTQIIFFGLIEDTRAWLLILDKMCLIKLIITFLIAIKGKFSSNVGIRFASNIQDLFTHNCTEYVF